MRRFDYGSKLQKVCMWNNYIQDLLNGDDAEAIRKLLTDYHELEPCLCETCEFTDLRNKLSELENMLT